MLNEERSLHPSRRWLVPPVIACLLAAGVVLAPAAAEPASAAGDSLYVSPTGDDANDGSLSAPFRTIEHARDVVRTKNTNMPGDLTVFLRGGSYPVDSTIEFGAADSGSNGHRVVYAAYRDEKPVLEAGTKVTGWTQHTGNIWKAPLDREDKLRALYVNDDRAVMAQKTVTSAGCYGTYTVTAGQAPWAWESGTECDGITYALGDVPAVPKNQSDMELQTSTTWTTAITGIREVTTTPDGSQRAVLLQQPGAAIAQGAFNGDLQTNGAHTLSNAYEFLDAPGEFFFDRDAQTVYLYKDAGTDLSTSDVFAPNNVETVLEVSGTSTSDRVHDLTFTGITVQHSDWNLTQVDGSSFKQAQQGNVANTAYARKNFHEYTYRNVELQPGAVEISSAANIDFVRNRVQHSGADGIQLLNDVVDSKVEGNVTDDIGGSALNVGDPQHVYIGDGTSTNRERYQPGVEGAPKNISVRNNYFFDSAVLFRGSAAVSGYFLDSVAIENNRVEKTSWAGISVGWGWWNFNGNPQSINPGLPTTVARNNSIQRNEIHDIMRFLNDSGAVYTLGDQRGSVIDDNWSRGIRPGHTYGLHPDEGSANITYDDNVIEADPGIAFVINSGVWGFQNHLQIRNTWGPVNTIYDKNVPDSTIEDIRVVRDFIWPTQAYDVTVGAGVQPEYRDILGAQATMADFALPASVRAPQEVTDIAVRGVGDATRTLWLAPAGTTAFAPGATMTKAAGDATRMSVPTTNGTYKLFVVNADGTASAPSAASVVRGAAVTPPTEPAGQTIKNAASQTCLDLPGSTRDNGALPALWTCKGDPNQSFSYTANQEITVYGNKCLDSFTGTTPGTPVGIWDCNGGENQKWKVNADGTILSLDADLCISPVGGRTDLSTRVELATCSSAQVQKWIFPGAAQPDVTFAATVASTAPAGTNGWQRGAASLTLSASDAAAEVQYRVGGGQWKAYSAPVTFSDDGTYTVDYRAVGREGGGTTEVKVDATAPSTTAVTDPASGTVVEGGTIRAVFAAVDATSGVARTEYSVNGGPWVDSAQQGASFTAKGSYTVRYRSIDVAGNDEGVKSIVLTVAPRSATAEVKITSADPATSEGWYNQNVLVALSAPTGSTGVTVQYRLNNGAWTTYRQPLTVSRDGQTTIDHRLLRSSAVVAGSESQTVVKIDKTAPKSSLTRVPGSGTGTVLNPIALELSGTDATSGVSQVEYRLNDGQWQATDGQVVVGEVGDWLVGYRVTDVAGNTSAAKSVTIRILPNVTPEVKPSATTVARGAAVTLTIRGFVRWEPVLISVGGQAVDAALTDQNGAAKVTVRVPTDTPVGAQSITILGAGGIEATATIKVK